MNFNIEKIKRYTHTGIKSLLSRKLRSFLTALGVVFGVASVISMLAIGEGASYEAQERIKQLGSQNIFIYSKKAEQKDTTELSTLNTAPYGITHEDLLQIKNTINTLTHILPINNESETVYFQDQRANVSIIGTHPKFLSIKNLVIKEGRNLHSFDDSAHSFVCLIHESLAKRLSPVHNILNKTIHIAHFYFKIVGIYRSSIPNLSSENFDILIPYSTMTNIVEKDISGFYENCLYDSLILQVNDVTNAEATSVALKSIFNNRHKEQDYEIMVPLELMQQAEHSKKIFNWVIGSIAAISLIVGGIGIMNIMLANVTERTREIGVRRALGAKKKDIIFQFLIETILLSCIGGFIGIMIGIGIPYLVTSIAGIPAIVKVWTVLLSFSISILTGIIFGIYPAKKAAELNPVQALRYEG
jgi:putative ABC transport system permease protein